MFKYWFNFGVQEKKHNVVDKEMQNTKDVSVKNLQNNLGQVTMYVIDFTFPPEKFEKSCLRNVWRNKKITSHFPLPGCL